MKTLLSDVGEDALLDQFSRWFQPGGALRVGPGDDCAVVSGHRDDVLLKTDALVEGVHYESGEDAARLGHKAVARVFSDIAAMGGTPSHLLVTLALPVGTEMDWVEAFYDGARELCARHLCRIAGGELTRLPGKSAAVISVAATGRVAVGQALLRSAGEPGDVLAVTGVLGGTLASGHHLDFEPRLAEGQWLARRPAVHAMMDLSDGLAKDLPRLARASGCSFQLDASALPLRAGSNASSGIGDGEDYELLVSIHPRGWESLRREWKEAFPDVPLTAIGQLLPPAAGNSPVLRGGWDHFGC
ncbi:MAG: thiamine-phosphate kinase [Verrucomicrobiales bacterium]